MDENTQKHTTVMFYGELHDFYSSWHFSEREEHGIEHKLSTLFDAPSFLIDEGVSRFRDIPCEIVPAAPSGESNSTTEWSGILRASSDYIGKHAENERHEDEDGDEELEPLRAGDCFSMRVYMPEQAIRELEKIVAQKNGGISIHMEGSATGDLEDSFRWNEWRPTYASPELKLSRISLSATGEEYLPLSHSAKDDLIEEEVSELSITLGLEYDKKDHWTEPAILGFSREIFREVAERGIQDSRDKSAIEQYLRRARGTLYDLHTTLFPEQTFSDPAEYQKQFWRHLDANRLLHEGIEKESQLKGSFDELQAVVGSYMDEPWYSLKLERIMVDALMGYEVVLFGEELKQNPSRFSNVSILSTFVEVSAYTAAKGSLLRLQFERLWRRLVSFVFKLVFFFGIPAGLLFWGVIGEEKPIAIWAGAVGLGFSSLVAVLKLLSWLRRLWWREKTPTQHAEELLRKMSLVYSTLSSGGKVSLRQIRESMVDATANGASWPSLIFVLLDRALERDDKHWF